MAEAGGAIAALRRVAVEHLLADQDYVLLVVNPLVEGIVLPERFIEARQPVPVHIGYRLPVPIPDLQINEHGILGTLSFDRQPFACVFPWPSVMQVSVGSEHLVWVVPSEESETPPEEPKPRQHLRLV